ncbi:MAG: hypothetical protein OXG74_11755 [Acidobacteria bacterium]|nr:hypothetical protein [Acidobacteriota bacterium]
MSEPARAPDYATKADVDVLRAEMNAGFAELRGELRGEIAETRTEIAELRTEIGAVEARLTWRLLGGVAALLALFLTLFRLLDVLPAA